MFTSSTAERSPFPLIGEGQYAAPHGLDFEFWALFAIADLIHRKRSPFSYKEKALTRSKLRLVSRCPMPWLMLSGLWSLVSPRSPY